MKKIISWFANPLKTSRQKIEIGCIAAGLIAFLCFNAIAGAKGFIVIVVLIAVIFIARIIGITISEMKEVGPTMSVSQKIIFFLFGLKAELSMKERLLQVGGMSCYYAITILICIGPGSRNGHINYTLIIVLFCLQLLFIIPAIVLRRRRRSQE